MMVGISFQSWTLHRQTKTLSTMEEEFPEARLDEELQTSKIQDGCVKDVNSLQDLKLDRALQDQHNQNPESLKQDQEQQSLHSSLDHVQVQDKDSTQDEVDAKELKKCPLDPPQDQLEVQGVDQNPTEDDDDRGGALGDHHRWIQDLLRAEQSQDPGQGVDLDRGEKLLLLYFSVSLHVNNDSNL